MRWLGYILLSLVINVFLLLTIKAERLQEIKPAVKPIEIEINLVAVAKPRIKAVKKQEQNKKVIQKPPPKLQKVVVKKRAKKKIKVVKKKVKKKPIVKPKKIVKKEIKAKKNINHNQGKDLSNILHKAKYRKQTPIIYPKRAIRHNKTGRVILKVQISEFGKPIKIEIKQSSGYSLLDNSAIKTVKTWEFEPQMLNGKSIATWVEVPVKFEIKRGRKK